MTGFPEPPGLHLTCSNPRCRKLHRRRRPHGWCDGCYERWLRHGRPEGGPPDPDPSRIHNGALRAANSRAGTQRAFEARFETYRKLADKGVPVSVIARRMSLTTRTVWRYQAAYKPQLTYEQRLAEYRRMRKSGSGLMLIAKHLGLAYRTLERYEQMARAEGWLE